MNNKGMTIIEILLSLGLLSIVMVFIFNILADLSQEEALSNKRNVDSITRSTIIRLIENDFIAKGVIKINGCSLSDSICLDITYEDNTTKRITAKSNTLTYADEKWTLKSGNFDLSNFKYCYKGNIKAQGSNVASPYYFVKIVIPIKTKINNNNKYDIELTLIDNRLNTSIDQILFTNNNSYSC